MNQPDIAAMLVKHGRPGFYFRVLEEGEVQARLRGLKQALST
jgi:MOSC domain-containing protein YiiM